MSDNLQTDSAEKKKLDLSSPLVIIFITVFIDLIGFGIVIPILPEYVINPRFGGTPFAVGLLFASYSLMQFIFAPVLGQLSDKYGRRPVLFVSLIGAGIGFLTMGLATSLAMIFVGRIVAGIMGANISTAQAYIADITTPANRAKGMGLIGAAFGLGFIFGPAIGGILYRYGASVPLYFAAGLSFANAILLYFILPETVNKETFIERRGRFAVLLDAARDTRFAGLSLLYFLAITAFSMMTTAFPLYTSVSFGYTPEQNGYLFAYIGLLSALMQGGLIGFLNDKLGEIKMIVIGFFVLFVSLFAVPFVSQTNGGLLALLIGIAGFAIGNSLSSPSLTSLGSKFAPPEEQGATLGVLQSAASLARVVGPALAGVLLTANLSLETLLHSDASQKVDAASLFRMYWTAAAIMLIAFLLSLYFFKGAEAENLA